MYEFQSAFLKAAVPAAIASQAATGVPASITLAQAILESGWGRSELARVANNYFGIKAGDHVAPDGYVEMPTHEVAHGVTIMEHDRFASYRSPCDCFKAHGLLLAQAPRYAAAMRDKANPQAFAEALQACGYSTNPRYGDLLMELVRDFDLTQYDRESPASPAEGVKQ